MGKILTPSSDYAPALGKINVDPRLAQILQTAATASPYDVQFVSGVRPYSPATGTINHPNGWAVDVQLVDPQTGEVVPNYQSGQAFQAYEQFAQTARVVQQRDYPELGNNFRWGGYFNSKNGPTGYGAVDLMHFDINPRMGGATGLGSWETGASPALIKAYPGATSDGGLRNPRALAAVQSALAGRPAPPRDIPEAAVNPAGAGTIAELYGQHSRPVPLAPTAGAPGANAADSLAFNTPTVSRAAPVTNPAGPMANAGDQLGFNPVSASMADALPLAGDSSYGHTYVGSANASGSPDDRQTPLVSLYAKTEVPQTAGPAGGSYIAQPASARAASTPLQNLYANASRSPDDRSSTPPVLPAEPAVTPPLPNVDPRSVPVTPANPPAGYGAPTAAAPAAAPAAPTVTVNGHTYVVGAILKSGNNYYKVQPDGTFVKAATLPIGTGTVAAGVAGPLLTNGIKTVQASAPGVVAQAGTALQKLFGGVFGGSNSAPVPPMDVPVNTTSNVPQTAGPAGANAALLATVASGSATGTVNGHPVNSTGSPDERPAAANSSGSPDDRGVSSVLSSVSRPAPTTGTTSTPSTSSLVSMFNVPHTTGPVGQSSSVPQTYGQAGQQGGSSAPGTPLQSLYAPNSSGSPDDRSSTPAPAYTTKTATMQQINPDYIAWQKDQAASPFSSPGTQGLSPDDRDSVTGVANAVPGLTSAVFAKPLVSGQTSPVVAKPAPPKYVPVTQKVQSPIQQMYAPPAQPALYSSAGYTYQKNADGSYTKVGVVDPSLTPSQRYYGPNTVINNGPNNTGSSNNGFGGAAPGGLSATGH